MSRKMEYVTPNNKYKTTHKDIGIVEKGYLSKQSKKYKRGLNKIHPYCPNLVYEDLYYRKLQFFNHNRKTINK